MSSLGSPCPFSSLLLRLLAASLLPASTSFGFFVITYCGSCCGSFITRCDSFVTCCGSFIAFCSSAILLTVTLFPAYKLLQAVNYLSA